MAQKQRIYLDYHATAPMRPAVREKFVDALDRYANPSSIHEDGRKARSLIEEARRDVAQLVSAKPENVIFTSGATEANCHVLAPIMLRGGARQTVGRLLIPETEHPSVLALGRIAPDLVELIPVDRNGWVSVDAISDAVARNTVEETATLISVMAVNNETGVIQPIEEIGERLANHQNAFFHVDAVQAAGKMPLDLKALKADFLTLSAHKIGGPKGAGALVLASADLRPAPLLTGGGQELKHRAGTENTPAIAAFGEAAKAAFAEAAQTLQLQTMRDDLEEALSKIAEDTVFFGKGTNRVPTVTCFAVPGIKAETALIALDLEGFSLSSGSACSSGRVSPSHVLQAMGAGDDLAGSALRLSIGWGTTQKDLDLFTEVWASIAQRLRKM